MISFVRFDSHGGIWANKDKALKYLSEGYKIYTDETCETELTQEEIEAMDETVQCPHECVSTQTTVGQNKEN